MHSLPLDWESLVLWSSQVLLLWSSVSGFTAHFTMKSAISWKSAWTWQRDTWSRTRPSSVISLLNRPAATHGTPGDLVVVGWNHVKLGENTIKQNPGWNLSLNAVKVHDFEYVIITGDFNTMKKSHTRTCLPSSPLLILPWNSLIGLLMSCGL